MRIDDFKTCISMLNKNLPYMPHKWPAIEFLRSRVYSFGYSIACSVDKLDPKAIRVCMYTIGLMYCSNPIDFNIFNYKGWDVILHQRSKLCNTEDDVMGLVIAIAELQRDHSDKSKHMLNIHIQDAKGLQLRVNLWGDYAYKMQDYIHNNPDNHHRPSVSTYFTSSKLFINSDIDEAIAEVWEPIEECNFVIVGTIKGL
uniref:Uncharacterized protein n=1 Tax=Lactuca sativa TaxID=4236 RepID=A0A9R1VBP5_LACSA|nr:hypothetical protein LSAT_V11C600327350 [Lactuca sativa]